VTFFLFCSVNKVSCIMFELSDDRNVDDARVLSVLRGDVMVSDKVACLLSD